MTQTHVHQFYKVRYFRKSIIQSQSRCFILTRVNSHCHWSSICSFCKFYQMDPVSTGWKRKGSKCYWI